MIDALTDDVEVDEFAAGGVIPAGHLTLVLPCVRHLHAADHQDELRPVLAHHGLDPRVQGVAQVVEGHQLGDGGRVAEPGDLRGATGELGLYNFTQDTSTSPTDCLREVF